MHYNTTREGQILLIFIMFYPCITWQNMFYSYKSVERYYFNLVVFHESKTEYVIRVLVSINEYTCHCPIGWNREKQEHDKCWKNIFYSSFNEVPFFLLLLQHWSGRDQPSMEEPDCSCSLGTDFFMSVRPVIGEASHYFFFSLDNGWIFNSISEYCGGD